MTFHLTLFILILVWFGFPGGRLFMQLLLARLAVCSLCVLTICNFNYFPFWFLGA